MKNEAQNNLSEIKITDVIDKIKSLNPEEFSKMIIDSNEQVERSNYFFVKYKAKSAQRESLKLSFPIYGSIESNMAELEGGDSKHGELALFPSEKIIDTLSSQYQINPEVDPNGSDSNFNFPIEENGSAASPQQKSYFIADRTFKETCSDCTGKKLVTCEDFDCEGRHEWTCENCNGVGQLKCDNCAGSKKVVCGNCNGNDRVKCRRCGGDGRVNDGMIAKAANSKYAAEKKCGDCQGRGHKPCTDCTRGRVVCSPCSGQGKVTCPPCSGKKKITCAKCYGDKERYGLIDCPQCKAQGEMGYISYVRTTIHSHTTDKLFAQPNGLEDVSDDEVMGFANKQGTTETTVVNINANQKNNRDEYIKEYAEEIMTSHSLSLDSFNKLLTEEVYYQVIPCVQVKYKHMLTNETMELSILDFFDNPKLKFHKEAEAITSDMKDKGKKLGRFFGKLFKTKNYKSQDDSKKEIKLMIYLAKADGKIEEEEKGFLAENINSIEGFTSTEKGEFFNLMNNPNLPALTKEEVTFSSKEKLNEVIAKLTALASSDGEIEKSEQDLLNNIMSLNE